MEDSFPALKEEFLSVNGFDEDFVGWGYEDSDFAIRLLKTDIFRKNFIWYRSRN